MADTTQKNKKNNMDDFIQLKKDNILRIGIRDAEGKETGEHLEFDLEDIDLPLRLNRSDIEHQKNLEYIRNQILVIEKRQDVKGKYILTKNQEDTYKALNEFYKREEQALDLFLGEGGTKKMLNGRKPYIEMYNDIVELLEPIMPKLHVRAEDIKNKIASKYGKSASVENVLK